MLRNIIVCVAFVVGGLCFGVMYVVEYVEYADVRDGRVVEGVVDAVGEEHIWFSYVDERGKRREAVARDVDEEVRGKLSKGDRVEVLTAEAGTALALAHKPPSIGYLITLGILVLIGASFIFLPLLERRRLVRAGGDPIKVITVMLRKSRFNAVVTFVFFGGLTYVFFGVGFLDWDPTSETGVGGYIVFGFLVAVCGLIAVISLRTLVGLINIQGSWMVKTIRDNPQEIAWIYESVARTQGVKMSGFSTVYIWFADGRNYIVQLGHTGAEEFIQALAARAPHAQIGYSEEVQKLYAEDPSRFRPGG